MKVRRRLGWRWQSLPEGGIKPWPPVRGGVKPNRNRGAGRTDRLLGQRFPRPPATNGVAALSPGLYAALTDEVKWAIRYHDGAYGCGKYELGGKETALQMLLHAADMWSSRIGTLEFHPR